MVGDLRAKCLKCVAYLFESLKWICLKVKKRYLCLKVLSVFVMVSWRQRRWWPHISCPCLSGSGFSLLAVLLFTLLLTRTCLEFRISRFSSPLLAFRYRPLYYSSALTHTNFHNTLISQICPATQNSKCGC